MELLCRFGNCISYTEAQRYINDMAILADNKTSLSGVFIPSNLTFDRFTQFAFDNLDFYDPSIEGNTTHGTTHIIYQHGNTENGEKPVATLDLPITHSKTKIKEVSRAIDFSTCSLTKTDKAHSRSLKDSTLGHVFSTEYNHDFSLIWNLINMETDSLNFVPRNWSDFHETIASLSDTASRTEIGYGPFVPSSPTSVEVVEQSIDYCSKVAQHFNQMHVVITVDEAIYEIVYGLKTKFPQKYKNVIPRMGGFHICLNFLGAIGRIMSNSGLEDILVDRKIFL